jgi:hypothetical protein
MEGAQENDKETLSDDDIKVLVDFFSVLIEIEQDLKKKGISI